MLSAAEIPFSDRFDEFKSFKLLLTRHYRYYSYTVSTSELVLRRRTTNLSSFGSFFRRGTMTTRQINLPHKLPPRVVPSSLVAQSRSTSRLELQYTICIYIMCACFIFVRKRFVIGLCTGRTRLIGQTRTATKWRPLIKVINSRGGISVASVRPALRVVPTRWICSR